MDEQAIKLRREYNRKYREENKESINKRQNEWRRANRDKVKQYNKNYWTKKARELQTV